MKAFSRFQQPPLLGDASNLSNFASLLARRCWPILRLLHRFVLALALAIITEPLVTLSFGFLLDVTLWPVPHLRGSVGFLRPRFACLGWVVELMAASCWDWGRSPSDGYAKCLYIRWGTAQDLSPFLIGAHWAFFPTFGRGAASVPSCHKVAFRFMFHAN